MSPTNTDPITPDPDAMEQALHTLRGGGVVAFPTETVYGLGAAISNERAVGAIFDLKDRPRSRPLLAHVAGVEMAKTCVSEWPPRAQELAERFWPGPLTLVLPKDEGVPSVVVAGGSTVGLRCPAHRVALELIESLGEPIAGTSANRAGRTPAVSPEHVRESFEPDCVFVLDAGRSPGGLESTVLLLGKTPGSDRILRPGPIGACELGLDPAAVESAPTATGPMGRIRVVAAGDLQQVIRETQPMAIITHHPKMIAPLCPARVFVLPGDAEGYSRDLYAAVSEAIRSVGENGWVLLVKPDEAGDHWEALRHRLERIGAGA